MKEVIKRISGIVTGNDQHVGFRAMILKQAIKHNLVGYTKNLPEKIVNFILQGDPDRLDDAVKTIKKGTVKSSDIKVVVKEEPVDLSLNTFTIYDWTSTSRNIGNPYDIVFYQRKNNVPFEDKDVKDVWHMILKGTLREDTGDLEKLHANHEEFMKHGDHQNHH